jgi:amidohydrolase family protein
LIRRIRKIRGFFCPNVAHHDLRVGLQRALETGQQIERLDSYMEAALKAGLTPYAALEAATRTPAEFLNALGEAGVIGRGKRADLVLLEANPLEDISNTEKRAGVMAQGGGCRSGSEKGAGRDRAAIPGGWRREMTYQFISLFIQQDLQVCIKLMIIAQLDHVPQIIPFEVIA